MTHEGQPSDDDDLRAFAIRVKGEGMYRDLMPGERGYDAVPLMSEVLKKVLGLRELPEGMKLTPERFVRYLLEFSQPVDADVILSTKFEGGDADGMQGMVVQSNIPFRMICEHHLLPAWGRAAVGYIPNGKVVGLSKLTRLVQRMGTAKPTLQELVCEEITQELVTNTGARGAIVFIQAEHSCMGCRGVNSPNVLTSTSRVSGVFRDVPAAREEFFNLLRRMGS
jgi:GTP cyclohydrolase I